MTGREKIDAAVEFLKSRKVSASTAAPPLWRVTWRLGLNVPPPHFLGFLPIALLTGLPFGVLMTAFGFAFLWAIGAPLNRFTALAGAFSASFFGTAMASHYAWSARRLGLPRWSEFDPLHDEADDAW